MIRRSFRALSDQGLELFCDSMQIDNNSNDHENNNKIINNKKNESKKNESKKNDSNIVTNNNLNTIYDKLKKKKNKIKKFMYELFTSDYDRQLENNITTMRFSTYKLLSYIYDNKKIPEYTNNGITNLVALILSDGEKSITRQKVKYNISFYLDLAINAMKTNDHQTAILIKSAIANINIKRLKIKYNKKQKKIIKKLDEFYGGFLDCHRQHLKDIIKNSWDHNWLPSTMIIQMHHNKIEDYSKSFRKLGRNTDNFNVTSYKLHSIKSDYYHRYKNTDKNLIHLYNKNPFDLSISKKLKSNNDKLNSIHELLYTLSINVDSKKNKKKI